MIKLSGPALSKVDRNDPKYQLLAKAHPRIAAKDATTWGTAASAEAAIRLNWVELDQTSRDLLPLLDALAAKFRERTDLVLCGMGGSSLAPEVIAQTFKKRAFILDSTDPDYINRALGGDPINLLILVASKSGSTIETSSQRAFFEKYLSDAGLNPTEHMVFVTDPGSPLDQDVRKAGFTVINADPNVGGRFSALTAFGLTPAALMGVDASVLLDQASDCKEQIINTPEVILDVAYLLLTQAEQFLGFTDSGSNFPGLSDWIEQLIAESTGKDQRGRLPIATEGFQEAAMGGAFSVAFAPGADLTVEAELGEHFLFWEWVTALLGAALEIDPFNQPNVTEAKEATSAVLAEWNNSLPEITSANSEGDIEIFGDGNTLVAALKNLIANTDSSGYIAITAYLDRVGDSKIAELRKILSEKSGRPVSFGWGPRFLHSTGQFHKGGQQNGSFLQITGETVNNYQVPGRAFDFRTLLMAQALGDNRALATRKYPLLRLHCKERSAGIDQILRAAKAL
ncbi:Phosphoglucose isomerase (PGI) [Candidatus Nanopelagicaceae bacterium]